MSEQMRKEFEEFIAGKFPSYLLNKKEGAYVREFVDAYWIVWQASRQ